VVKYGSRRDFMGSRMMHLIVGEIVASSLDVIKNKRDFLMGSIAPDAAFSFDRKVITHYFEGDVDKRTRQVNYQRYIDTYLSDSKDDYSLGYLTHLISDNVWMECIYYPFQKFIKVMHGDFEIIEQNKNCELEVYNFDEIIEYINLSISKAIAVIEEIKPSIPKEAEWNCSSI
jgi:hypothetical protein